MVKISEITTDGGERQQEQRLRFPQDVPLEIIREHILPLLERCDYPSLLCTSRAFHEILTLPRLFKTRSNLGRTEELLYTFIGFPPFVIPRWFVLHRRNNSLRLSMIGSLPPMIPGSAVVTIGHEIYILGGCLLPFEPVRDVIVVDCRFHTWRRLPDMSRARQYAAAGVIDGKIYVIGGCVKRGGDWVEVFDVSSETWGTVTGQSYPGFASLTGIFGAYVVMENKIYILDRMCCLVYEPRRSLWESWGLGSPQRWYWYWASCVVDDMLYAFDTQCSPEYPIVVFDPRDVEWRPVRGVSMDDLLSLAFLECRMANLGGKLVILGRCQSMCYWDYYQDKDVWCIVIELERRENGEIWGKVESTSRVLSCWMYPSIELSRTVTL